MHMQPGDEITYQDEPYIVLDPSYLGEGPLLEHAETGEELLVSIDDWEAFLEQNEADNAAYRPSQELPVPCPSCGEITHFDPENIGLHDNLIIDCTVCCRPMNIHWDGEKLSSSDAG